LLTLDAYISQLREDEIRAQLATELQAAKNGWSVNLGNDPVAAFSTLVDTYVWLGQLETKARYQIAQNLARNLPGAMLQDFLIQVVVSCLEPYPSLEVFTEVRVPFGRYPIWEGGVIRERSPAQLVDLAVGYRLIDGVPTPSTLDWPQPVCSRLGSGESVVPLVVVNSKIRVSQSEFFDFMGREELLTKGNPNCMSVEVALRAEMDLSIVSAAQASDKFFLLGVGGERNVRARPAELARFVEELQEHLGLFMVPSLGTDVEPTQGD
jgi:hypothetical protein